MQENINRMPIMGKRLDEKESQKIIETIRKKYPDININEDSEYFIITREIDGQISKINFLKRKFLPTIYGEMPKLPIEEALEAEIIDSSQTSTKEKVKNLREKNKEEKEAV
ncbi:MAG TPA: hypothetical protein PLQ44_02900 [Candidatus Paceibacterota bacterium]|jgi:hypothetical protein|nr:hypothetical protein [Candidatus Paceibacterota bacterium]